MIQILNEYVVKEHARGHFELAFGPGGAWSDLFERSPGFRGITLLRDTENPRRFLAAEVWDALAQREQAVAGSENEHASLEAALADWTESRSEVGTFSMRAQAAVRPRRRSRRSGRSPR
jgi:heme-degrading monooxygenase HmoA